MTIPAERSETDMGNGYRTTAEPTVDVITKEQLTLARLRRALGKTQTQVAAALDTSQSNLSQIETKDDALLSTVAKIVRALDAKLEMHARLEDGRLVPLTLDMSQAGSVTDDAAKKAKPSASRGVDSQTACGKDV